MSNPTVTIGNVIAAPADPQVIRKTFSRITYAEQEFNIYGANEFDDSRNNIAKFDPNKKGERFFMFLPLSETNPTAPSFSYNKPWEGLKNAPSGFITSRKSIMPRMFIPSRKYVDNGHKSDWDNETMVFFPPEGGSSAEEAFNWDSTYFADFISRGGISGQQYVILDGKNGTAEMTLDNSSSNPLTDIDLIPNDGSELVGNGAFCLLLRTFWSNPSELSSSALQQNDIFVNIEFGEFNLSLSQTGALTIKYLAGGSSEEKTYVINLTAGKAKDAPPQTQQISEDYYLITVYPVWNGIVVQDGFQQSLETQGQSTFIKKKQGAGILQPEYSSPFNPTSPPSPSTGVEVGIGVGDTLVKPLMGDSITISANYCKVLVAYLPIFFNNNCSFDDWVLATDSDPGNVEFTYNVYPIWTANGTSYELNPAPQLIKSTIATPDAGLSYYYVPWVLKETNDLYSRYAGEIFGAIFEIIEEIKTPIKNGNGGFEIKYTGGDAGDSTPTGDWTDYIQSLSVTTSIDGSSGEITVDKYGIAGQDASVTQSIGAITIDATGGFGTLAGNIFKGFAIGINDNKTSDGATWSIPLVGLEKKLDDIALILAPYMDGYILSDAIDYLCRYAGLISDLANAPTAGVKRLQATDDINTARYDWRPGTNVRSALDEVMESTLHRYVVRDGKIYFYELDPLTGWPIFVGVDWSVSYPSTRMMQVDQSPNFDVIRNDIVIIGLEGVLEGSGTEMKAINNYPRVERRKSITSPDVPWAKSMVENMPGLVTAAEIIQQADNVAALTSTYDILGKVTIAGNAQIRPYDTWGDYLIYSVTHNMDFQSKVWTTDLELHGKTK